MKLIQRDRIILLAVWLAAPVLVAQGQIELIPIQHEHESSLIGYGIETALGRSIDATGGTDVSGDLNEAIQSVFDRGGGNIYLPAGQYRVDKPVTILAGVGLRGDFQKPSETEPIDLQRNSVIHAYHGRGLGNQDDALFTIDGSASMDGFVFWYPEQKADNIVPYSPTIRLTTVLAEWSINATARNLHFVNAYIALQNGYREDFSCIQLMKNLYGSPLKTGVEVWKDFDIPRILEVHFNPRFWPASGLANAPAMDGPHKAFMFNEGAGIRYHRTDGSELANIYIEGYYKGMELNNGTQTPGGNWIDNEGHYVDFHFKDCQYGVWMNNIKRHGSQYYQCSFEGTRSALHVEDATHGIELAMFFNCSFSGGEAAITQSWPNETNPEFSMMFTECVFNDKIDWQAGTLNIAKSRFEFEGPHVILGEDAIHAAIVDNVYQGDREIVNRSKGRVIIEDRPFETSNAPHYDYRVNRLYDYIPAKEKLFLASDYGAIADGKTDASHAIQRAIDAAQRAGGGYVLLPAGTHVLEKPITVKAGVELRGVFDFWHHGKFVSIFASQGKTKGSLIMVRHGKGDTEGQTIFLENNAGINGISFHYPEQTFDTEAKEVREIYPWLIRAAGDRSWVKHVMAINPWRFIDVADSAADVYLGYNTGAPLKQAIQIGESPNCFSDNNHFNSWYWNTVFFDNKPSEPDPDGHYRLNLDNWLKANSHAFTLKGSQNVDVYGTFMFCTSKAWNLLPGNQSGEGPSGIIINSGNDWSKYGLVAHASGDLTMINIHHIDVARNDPDPDIASIYMAPGFDDSIHMINVSSWGTSPRMFSFHGDPKGKIKITNLSYQLWRMAQNNRLWSGQLEVVNGVRWIPIKPIEFEIGEDASVSFHTMSLPFEPDIIPPDARLETRYSTF